MPTSVQIFFGDPLCSPAAQSRLNRPKLRCDARLAARLFTRFINYRDDGEQSKCLVHVARINRLHGKNRQNSQPLSTLRVGNLPALLELPGIVALRLQSKGRCQINAALRSR